MKSNVRKQGEKRSGRPTKYTADLGRMLTGLVMEGYTTDEAAREIGVHPATVYRWQNRYPELYEAVLKAQRVRFRLLHPSGHRPRVPWRHDCPACGAEVMVRTTWGFLKFWTCERWPWCRFSSWRPLAPMDCPRCDKVLFWSHSRKSFGCDWCGYRRRM